jgi:cysteine desulfurase
MWLPAAYGWNTRRKRAKYSASAQTDLCAVRFRTAADQKEGVGKFMKVYADNAATTKMSRTAIDAMLPYLDKFYGNPSSLYSIGQEAAEAMQNARETMARCLGCEAREITFTSGGSEADNQAIISAAVLGEKKGKKHIISTAFEHHAVLHTLNRLEKQGFEITLLDVHENGVVTPEEVASAIRDDTCLVTIMYANNEIGTIQPIAGIGEVCKKKGVLFHTDAVQAAGHLHIDVKAQNIDMLTLSAHKFHGPKGIGALYARRGIPLTNIIEGGAQERGKRAGTENVASIVSMAAAFEEACDHIDENAKKISALRDKLIDGLSKIPHSVLNGDREQRLPGNVNFCFEGIEGESLLLLLDQKGISASSGSACTSGSLDPSHVLLAIGRPHEIAHGSLRLTLCEWNTEEEVDYMLQVIPEVVSYLRSISPIWRDLAANKKQFIL